MNWFTKYKRQLQESAWLLGICESGYGDLKAGRIHWIDNGEYKGKKWFADPFILNYDDKQVTLLVEEFDYKVHRGRIARLYVDRNSWKVTDCKIILDLDTHLSFPMIWREDNNVYVFPENYHSGGWNMYRYNEDGEKLEIVKEVVNAPLTDAIMYSNNNIYYILSTFEPTPSGKVLTIWRSDNIMGEFMKTQDIVFNENIARNAGMMFKYDDKIIRPAQECNETYGHAISFQQVNINDGLFSFKELFRWYSSHPEYNIGTHTYNQHPNGMAVIDVKGYRYSAVGRVLKQIDKVLENLHLKKPYKPV